MRRRLARGTPLRRWERSSGERHHHRATFDEDAEAYERSRPVAPASTFDSLLSLAGLSEGSRVVEIGPGTGQATRELVRRGLDVVAVELGPALAAATQRNVPQARVVVGAFEAWDAGAERFDAVFACNSFHWIDPDVRFSKAASLLRPAGHLAVLAMSWAVPDDASRFWWDVQEDWEAFGGREDPAGKHPSLVLDLAPLVRASGFFEEPVVVREPFTHEFTTETYLLNLSTQSGFKETIADPTDRSRFLDRVRTRIDRDWGGAITAHLLAVLVVARVR